jgi:hypothetical protein
LRQFSLWRRVVFYPLSLWERVRVREVGGLDMLVVAFTPALPRRARE